MVGEPSSAEPASSASGPATHGAAETVAEAPPATQADSTHIECRGVSKHFGDYVALDAIDLDVKRAGIEVIIGGSGAGKTTLLKLLIGLDRPTTGSIRIAGEDIAPMSARELNRVRKKLGMVFQYSALLDSLDVMENVAFPLREHQKQLSEKEIRSRVIDKLAALGLHDIEKRAPSELSGGMRKRVALARALMLEPEAVFYDEPTSGLDPLTARLVDEMILETRERFGVTSVVISHDMAGAMRIADRIHLLSEGRVAISGTPFELVRSEHPLVRKFIDASGIRTDTITA